jgi:hypothetical protein
MSIQVALKVEAPDGWCFATLLLLLWPPVATFIAFLLVVFGRLSV